MTPVTYTVVALSKARVELARGKFELRVLGILDLDVVWAHVAGEGKCEKNAGEHPRNEEKKSLEKIISY